jgi:hypothetical protein
VFLLFWPAVSYAQTVSGASPAPNSRTHGLQLPDCRSIRNGPVPLIFTPARVPALKARFAKNPGAYPALSNNAEYRVLHQATLFQLTGKATSADGGAIDTTDEAVSWLVKNAHGFYEPDRSGSDQARWMGEVAILSFGWLWDRMSSADRATVITAINRGVVNSFTKAYGDFRDQANNHGWGYTRNGMLWAVMSYCFEFTMPADPAAHCSWTPGSGRFVVHAWNICGLPQRRVAEQILTEVDDRRWTAFVKYFSGWRGGTRPDGHMHYGKYLDSYFTVPFQVWKDYGRALSDESPYFADMVYQFLYAITPKPTLHSATRTVQFQAFPHGDQSVPGQGIVPAVNFETADYFTYAALHWDGTPLEGYARKFLTDRDPPRSAHIKILDAALGEPGTAMTSLPLDYYAAGPGHLYVRNAPDPSTLMLFQLGSVDGHHMHADAGSFQILRCGQSECRWGTRETVNYDKEIVDETGSGGVSGDLVWAHNGITVDNHDYTPRSVFTNRPAIPRLTRTNAYVHGVTDIRAYSGVAATCLVREFVYVRAFDTAVSFDRACTASATVPKTTLIHCHERFQLASPGVYRCANGNQILDTYHLSGSVRNQRVTFTEIDESGGGALPIASDRQPQYRLQAAVQGTATSSLVNVYRAYSPGGPSFTAALAQAEGRLMLTLALGSSKVVLTFIEGPTSTGGTIAFDGRPAESFGNDVDQIDVTPAGVTWK